jgi:hypothetical protein
MCVLLEADYQEGERDLDAMMRRLKDLSAYSLIHAEIMDQREFGMTSNPRWHHNQERLRLLSEETFTYQGEAETIEQEVATRKAEGPGHGQDNHTGRLQPRLL